jgi:hypothetical protein
MSDSFQGRGPGTAAVPAPHISIAITPMRRTEQGVWESGPREGAQFYLLELVYEDGEDLAVVIECRNERTAALAARVAAGTLAALGFGQDVDGEALAAPGEVRIEAFDEETAAILADHPTPEVAAPSGEWRTDVEDEAEEDDTGGSGRRLS